MGRRGPADLRLRLGVSAAALGVLLAACSGAGASDPPVDLSSPSTAPTPEEDPAWPTPTPSPTPSTPEEQAIALYMQQYLPLVEQMMEARQPADPRLAEVAADLGLANGRNPAVSLLELGTTADGHFVPSIQRVEAKDTDTVELVDCQRRDFVHRNSRGGQVLDPGGQRHEVFVTVRRLDGRWKVTRYMPADRCVPKDLAEQVKDAYLTFNRVVTEASAIGDPGYPALVAVAAGNQLEGLREAIAQDRARGQVHRDYARSHPTVIRIRDYDTVAIIRDCIEEDPRTGLYDANSGERLMPGEQSRPGDKTLALAQLELMDHDGRKAWKVVARDVAEEDSKCDPAA